MTLPAELWEMRQSGMTLQAVGEAVGVTREAVRAVLSRYYGTTQFITLRNLDEIARQLGFSDRKIIGATGQLSIVPKRTGKFILFTQEDIEKLRRHFVCRHCGKPLPKYHHTYCEECSLEYKRYHYPFLSEEQKEQVRQRKRVYMAGRRQRID